MTWARLDDNWDDSAKLEAAAEALGAHGDSAFLLWVRAVTYCNRRLTDGVVPGAKLRVMTKHKRPQSVVDALVAAGALDQRDGDEYEVHDFLDWNEPRAAIEAKRIAKREAGKVGGIRSGASRTANQEASKVEAGASGVASPLLPVRFAAGEPLSSPSPSASTKHREEGVALELVPSEPGPAADVRAVWDAYADAARQAGRKPPKVTSERSARVRARIAELGVETVIAAVRGVWLHPWAKPGGTCGSPAGAVSPEDVMRNVANVEKYAATWEESQRGKAPKSAVQREADRGILDEIVRERRAALGLAPTQNTPALTQDGPATASGSELGAA